MKAKRAGLDVPCPRLLGVSACFRTLSDSGCVEFAQLDPPQSPADGLGCGDGALRDALERLFSKPVGRPGDAQRGDYLGAAVVDGRCHGVQSDLELLTDLCPSPFANGLQFDFEIGARS